MSLSAVAPTEKTENLIYTLLPVSVTLCLASVFLSDPGTWLYWVGALAPILSILLYEIGWDETRVKKHHQETLKESLFHLEEDFYNCNLFIRTWESTLQKPPTPGGVSDYLQSEYEILVMSTVSSYTAKRRFWRQRASTYVLASIPFLTFVPLRMVDLILREGIPGALMGYWFLLLLGVWALFTLATFWVIYRAKAARESEIESFLESLISYIYWKTMIATDAVRNHEEYLPNTEKWIVKSELESLATILARYDWSVFLERWKRVKNNINDLTVDLFKQKFESQAHNLWAQFIYDTRMRRGFRQTQRQFAWFIYYSEKAKQRLEGTSESLLDHLVQCSMSSDSLQSLLDPNDIIDRLPEQLLTDECEDNSLAGTISYALNILFTNSGGNVAQAIRRIIMELTIAPQDVGLDKDKMARLVYRYIKERTALGMEPFLKGYRADHILRTVGVVQSDDNRVWVLVDWFGEVEPAEMVKALETRGWRGILTDPRLSPAVLERVRRFESRDDGEIRALELLERVFVSDPDTLAELTAIRERLEDIRR